MSNELVRASDSASWDLISAGGLDGMLKACEALAKSKVLPAHLTTGGAVLAVVLRGREMGMGPLEACHSMHNIEGRVVLDATAQLALAKRAGVRCQWSETTDQIATLHMSRGGEEFVSTYTIAMAKRAGLAGRATWAKYPEAMLRARAITAGIRAFCPDVLGAGAVYDRDEIADEPTPAPSRRPAAIDVEAVPVEVLPRVVVDGHHPSATEAVNKAFAIFVSSKGLTYKNLACWLQSDDEKAGRIRTRLEIPPSRPTAWEESIRQRLAAMLDNATNGPLIVEAVAAWTAANAPARQPGDEAPDASNPF